MDVQRPPTKKNVAIISGPDGTPIEQQSGKRLPAPRADIVGGQIDIVPTPKDTVKTPEVVVVSGPECYFCKSKDLVITNDRIFCNTCLKASGNNEN
jgi:hypothetical protein